MRWTARGEGAARDERIAEDVRDAKLTCEETKNPRKAVATLAEEKEAQVLEAGDRPCHCRTRTSGGRRPLFRRHRGRGDEGRRVVGLRQGRRGGAGNCAQDHRPRPRPRRAKRLHGAGGCSMPAPHGSVTLRNNEDERRPGNAAAAAAAAPPTTMRTRTTAALQSDSNHNRSKKTTATTTTRRRQQQQTQGCGRGRTKSKRP